MKKLFIVFAIVLFLATINLFAIEEKLQKLYGNEENTIYINILSFLISQINLNYERLISSKYSLAVGVGVTDKNIYDVSDASNWSFLTTVITLGIGVYPSGRYGYTLRGFYFMPVYSIISIDAKYKSTNESGNNLAHRIAVNFGYRWVLSNKITFDVSAGMGYRSSVTIKANSQQAGSIDYKVGVTHLGLQFGYSW